MKKNEQKRLLSMLSSAKKGESEFGWLDQLCLDAGYSKPEKKRSHRGEAKSAKFREKAVILALRRRSASAAARELGIPDRTVRYWVSEAEKDGSYRDLCRNLCERTAVEAIDGMSRCVERLRETLEGDLKGAAIKNLSDALKAFSKAQKRCSEIVASSPALRENSKTPAKKDEKVISLNPRDFFLRKAL